MYDLGCMLVESRPFVVLDGLPGLYGLKYDSATACGLPLYLCSYKLVGSATIWVLMLTVKKFLVSKLVKMRWEWLVYFLILVVWLHRCWLRLVTISRIWRVLFILMKMLAEVACLWLIKILRRRFAFFIFCSWCCYYCCCHWYCQSAN